MFLRYYIKYVHDKDNVNGYVILFTTKIMLKAMYICFTINEVENVLQTSNMSPIRPYLITVTVHCHSVEQYK